MWNNNSRDQTQPVDSFYSQSDIKLLKYLALLSMKHDIDSDLFFGTIVKAWHHQPARCNGLKIECRKDRDGNPVFIITNKEKVLTQFRMSEYLLQEKNPIKEFDSTVPTSTQNTRKNDQAITTIKDLKAGMKRVNIRATILTLPETREVLTRFGSYARLSNATIEDHTGSIKLALWNKQIDLVSMGDRIAIDNAKVVWFKGEPQLRIGRQGELKVL